MTFSMRYVYNTIMWKLMPFHDRIYNILTLLVSVKDVYLLNKSLRDLKWKLCHWQTINLAFHLHNWGFVFIK